MEIVDKMRETIAAGFPGSQLEEIEFHSASGKVTGILLWDGFADMEHIDRQMKLSKVLRDSLGEEAARTSFIFAYTPREYELMMAA